MPGAALTPPRSVVTPAALLYEYPLSATDALVPPLTTVRVTLAVRPGSSGTMSASVTRPSSTPGIDAGWKRASASRTIGVYAAPTSIATSAYHKSRSRS